MLNIKYKLTHRSLFTFFYSFCLFGMLMLNGIAFFPGVFQGRISYFIQAVIIVLGAIDIGVSIKKIKKDSILQFVRIFMAYFLIFLWSMTIVYYKHSMDFEDVIVSELYWLIPIILAFVTFVELKVEAVELTYKVVLINYTCVIIRTIQVYGIGYFFKIENYLNNYGSMLEVHSIGLSIGLFLIYFYYLHKAYNKKLDWTFWLGIIYMFLCGKRIAMLAFFLVIFIYKLISSQESFLQKKKLKFYVIVLIGLVFLYLIMVKFGLFQMICTSMNINSKSRFETWDLLSDQYSLSPFYLGKGIGFSMNYLDRYIDSGKANYWRIAGDVHNDILKTYIDIGFIPFALYIIWFIKGNIDYYIKRNRIQTAHLFFLLILYTVILMFTDNIMRYSLFLLVLYLMPASMNEIEQQFVDSVEV